MRPATSPLFRTAAATATALALAAAPVLVPSSAQACGGLFCMSTPVAQNAERILFEINGDGTVTTTVEIRYSGDPDGFSWVVPVTDTPELTTAPASALVMLDTATVPSITPPPTKCTNPGMQPPMAGGVDFAANESDGGVDVEDLPTVGPFDPEVVSSDDAEALIEWLNTNGYLITEEMEPMVADYVAQGMKFLAMKLTPGAGVADIAPIQMTYPATVPTVPIVLTAVSADPEMGILIFVAANERYESSNYTNLTVDHADVQMHPTTGENNYYPLISWMLDGVGGKGMVTEYASPSSDTMGLVNNSFIGVDDFEESVAFLQSVLQRRSYMTRLYTRASGPDMDIDPAFQATADGDIGRIIDLSDRPAVEICANDPMETMDVPCGDMYCGESAFCATTDSGFDGCVCPDGQVARVITAPSAPGRFLTQTVVCQSVEFDMLASARAEGDLVADACADVSCGDNGTCMDVGGFATCACEDGYAATAEAGINPTCSQVEQVFAPDQVVQWGSAGCSGCSTSGASAAGGAALALIILPPLVGRRRTRRL